MLSSSCQGTSIKALEPEALLAELVAMPSVSGDEAGIAALLIERLTEAGLTPTRVEGNVFVELKGGPGPTLLLASHMDTVGPGEAWRSSPWDAMWTGGKLVGLGANDAKGAVAAMCAAVASFAALNLQGTLQLALVVEEETTNTGMAQVLAATGMPDMAVIGEPTGLEVVCAQAGLAILEATWTGRSCHSAHAARVDHESALLAACTELAVLPSCTVFPARHKLMAPTTLVPAVLRSGDRHNRVPDLATCTFDVRLTPPDSAQEIAAWLGAKLPRATIQIKSDRLRPVDTAAEHALVQAALQASGKEAPMASNTMSDMALLAGVPAIKCGPGETSRSHTPDEFITREELRAGVHFYRELIANVCTATSRTTS